MNIIKLQNMLRGVPDDALINYVQNPQGEVPSYLALSELQRRKDTRAKYQAEQAPESSVAEDLEQETMSDQGGLTMLAGQPQMEDQGVAGLDTGDMYQEDSFAGGGIVAFEEGGEARYNAAVNARTTPTPRYAGLGFVAPAVMATGRAAAKYGGKGLKYLKDKALVGKPAVTGPTMNLPTGPVTPVLEAATKGFLKTPGFYLDTAVIGGVLYGIDEYGNKERITEDEASKIAMQKLEAENLKSMQDHTKTREAREALQKEEAKILKDQTAKGTGAKAETTQTQQTAETDEDYLRRRMALFKEAMGPNEDRTKLQEKIDKMEKRAARQEELAPYMALTEAGFKTMAGTSPFALANLGAGAQAGLQSYGAAQDKMAALEEKRYALINEAAKADRAEKQAIVKFGFDSEEAKANRDQKERLTQEELKVRREANEINRTRFSNEANYLKMAGFGQRNQAAIDKYVKDNMGNDLIILNQLRKVDPAKLDDKKKALLKSYAEKEARIQQEAMQKFDVNNLVNRARPGLAGTQFRSSDYTVEELPGQ
jgi:hypothetical protein